MNQGDNSLLSFLKKNAALSTNASHRDTDSNLSVDFNHNNNFDKKSQPYQNQNYKKK